MKNGMWTIVSTEGFYDGQKVTMVEGQVRGRIDEDGFHGGFVGAFRLKLETGVELLIPKGQFYSLIDFDEGTINLINAN